MEAENQPQKMQAPQPQNEGDAPISQQPVSTVPQLPLMRSLYLQTTPSPTAHIHLLPYLLHEPRFRKIEMRMDNADSKQATRESMDASGVSSKIGLRGGGEGEDVCCGL